jgi:hypothetical protein
MPAIKTELSEGRDKITIIYLLFVFSFILHVTDEALNDFLGFYNPLVKSLKEDFTFIPFPTFSFRLWISGLALLSLLLTISTIFIISRNKVYINIIKAFSVLMILNGLGHIAGSIWFASILPGLLSSPLLMGFSIYLIIRIKDISQ